MSFFSSISLRIENEMKRLRPDLWVWVQRVFIQCVLWDPNYILRQLHAAHLEIDFPLSFDYLLIGEPELRSVDRRKDEFRHEC